MTCRICKLVGMKLSTTTITLERDDTILVFKEVPAQVCDNCGEAYLDEATTERLLQAAESAYLAGVQVEVCKFVAA